MARATWTNISPMGPPPMMVTVSPISTPVSCRPRSTQARGSVMAASSKRDVGRNDQHVGFDDAPRDADVFGIGSVVEEQVFAEIFLVLGAVEAHLAGRGIERHHAHALLEAVHALADFLDYAGQFVAEERGRDDHAGVVAALIDLEIGAAGESDLDFDQHFALFHARDGHSFNLEIFFAVQDGGRHFSVHCLLPSQDSRFQVLPG